MIEKYKKQYKKDKGALWYDEEGKPRIEYVNYLEQRLETGFMNLLRETAVRCRITFPKNEQDECWFNEGTEKDRCGDFMQRLFNALEVYYDD